MVNAFYSPTYTSSGHAFDTTRKAKWLADSLADRPISGVELESPEPLAEARLADIHDIEYVRAVRAGVPRVLAESQGFEWDAELWPMVLASNGGAASAALSAMQNRISGSFSSGMHHARRDRGAGFCTFNGLVIAAHAALASGANSVLILDLDAHCGGGTFSLVSNNPRIWHLDVSVDSYDRYTPTERNTLDIVDDAQKYLPTIARRLAELEDSAPRFDLCLYNAGMDAHEDCVLGGLSGITRDILASRERTVFEWCRERRIAAAFVLAGGYKGGRLEEAGLVDLHRLTLYAAVNSHL
ncbi:MAG: hypothetical protein H7Z74_09215 [Anaerolineae bacterium]|nr:hypothetical protein [Gemmatimonadaceae bacterium]